MIVLTTEAIVLNAEAFLLIAETTVKRWIREGKLKCVRLGHRTIRIRSAELEEFLNNRTD